jgi:hypothetical protein
MLTGILMDVMQPLHEISHVVSRGFLLVGENPKQQVAGQTSLPPEHHAVGIVPVISWVDALLANRNRGSLLSQYL